MLLATWFPKWNYLIHEQHVSSNELLLVFYLPLGNMLVYEACKCGHPLPNISSNLQYTLVHILVKQAHLNGNIF